MFQYKPQLWVIPSLIAMMVTVMKLKVFQIYERLALLVYVIGFVMYFICVLVFWVDYFFNAWMIVVTLLSSVGFIVLMISELSDWSRQKEGKYWQVAFEDIDEETSQVDSL